MVTSAQAWTWSALLAAAALAGCKEAPNEGFQGYVEGDYLLVAPAEGGVIEQLHVKRGQQVQAAAPLFVLERTSELAAVREASQHVLSAQARASNLDAPRRPRELQALRSQLAQASAARALAATELKRAEDLYPTGAIAKAQLDTARRSHDERSAREAELQATLEQGRQSIGRDPERRGAEAEVEAARAQMAQAEWRLAQRSLVAPANALVHDTYYVAGERVAAGRPVLSLLPPGNLKLRFFVPEPVLGTLKLGQVVNVRCDGCGAPIAATISFVSTQAEYTPPILYNRSARAKLVYMVEARPGAVADAVRLHPGQPVDVLTMVAAK